MSELSVLLQVPPPPVLYSAVQPNLRLLGDQGLTVELPFAPLPLDKSGLAGNWQQLTRPGRLPLLIRSDLTLPVLKFTLTIAHTDRDTSVEPTLTQLEQLAGSGQRVTVSYGPREAGLWHITDLSLSLRARAPWSNEVTMATADMTLTQVSDVVGVGPLSGGVAPPAGAPPAQRTYVVKAGDTLWAIALRYYGDPYKWPTIADRNHVTNPRLLQIGTVLVIP